MPDEVAAEYLVRHHRWGANTEEDEKYLPFLRPFADHDLMHCSVVVSFTTATCLIKGSKRSMLKLAR